MTPPPPILHRYLLNCGLNFNICCYSAVHIILNQIILNIVHLSRPIFVTLSWDFWIAKCTNWTIMGVSIHIYRHERNNTKKNVNVAVSIKFYSCCQLSPWFVLQFDWNELTNTKKSYDNISRGYEIAMKFPNSELRTNRSIGKCYNLGDHFRRRYWRCRLSKLYKYRVSLAKSNTSITLLRDSLIETVVVITSILIKTFSGTSQCVSAYALNRRI